MILVTGGTGQLGAELCLLLDKNNMEYVAVGSRELDITKQDEVEKSFQKFKPTIVYHCAAFTAVDEAEDVQKELNYAINVIGTKNIAEACARYDATMIYVSTDYVFDGEKLVGEKWLESEQTNPQTEYGRTKCLGEKIVEKCVPKFYIIRTSWVFGNYGKNFFLTMKALAKKNSRLTVVNDQYGCPTWTRTLAEFMIYLACNQKEYGYYHLSNDSKVDTTWYDFAVEILKDTDVEVVPVSSDQFLTKARRPFNSTLDLSKAKATGFEILTWQEALEIVKTNKK